jgi:hypothetical protein
LLENIVIQFGDRIVKGSTDPNLWFDAAASRNGSFMVPPISLQDGTACGPVPIEDAKAVFFVRSLEGKSHEDLRFSDHMQPHPCLWIRVVYLDGEVIEGIVHNDSTFAFSPYFFMAPVDPEGNNKLVMVIKKQLTNLQVLGLRQPWPELPDFIHKAPFLLAATSARTAKTDAGIG